MGDKHELNIVRILCDAFDERKEHDWSEERLKKHIGETLYTHFTRL